MNSKINEQISDNITESLTNIIILEQILGITFVAVILTSLEIYSIIYIVFPQVKSDIYKSINSFRDKLDNKDDISYYSSYISPVIKTLAEREKIYITKANSTITQVAILFTILMILFVFILVFLITNEYNIRSEQTPRGLFQNIVAWSMLTILGIGFFQGFPCLIIGDDSMLCSKNSFAVASKEWKMNNDFASIALQTDICAIHEENKVKVDTKDMMTRT